MIPCLCIPSLHLWVSQVSGSNSNCPNWNYYRSLYFSMTLGKYVLLFVYYRSFMTQENTFYYSLKSHGLLLRFILCINHVDNNTVYCNHFNYCCHVTNHTILSSLLKVVIKPTPHIPQVYAPVVSLSLSVSPTGELNE